MRRRAGRRLSAGQDEPPFALTAKQGGALRLAALNPAAKQAGLEPGMALASARAILPGLVVEEADPQADSAYLLACAAACEIFTPLTALDGNDGLLLDITGCAHLFGGEEDLRQRAGRRAASLGLGARATIAGTPDAARAFARFSRAAIVPPGQEDALARALPVAALGADADTARALARAGLQTLGDLASRPSAMLTARFGADVTDSLHRILGREDIRVTPLRALPECMAERHFPEPLGSVDALLGVIERLAWEAGAVLEQRGHGGRVFEASFFRTDGVTRRLTVETAQPTRDAAVLMRLMKLRIEALADPLDPGFGFDAARLCVVASEPIEPAAPTLDGRSEAAGEEEFAALAGRLIARFGRDRVMRFIARDSHDPVRPAGAIPWLARTAPAAWPQPEPGHPPARPLTLFEPPQVIEALAEVPDGPPLRFRWRRILHEVARAEGPERIAPEWWRDGGRPPATRDYYRVENEKGHRFWVFREGLYEDETARPRWFLHGLFA